MSEKRTLAEMMAEMEKKNEEPEEPIEEEVVTVPAEPEPEEIPEEPVEEKPKRGRKKKAEAVAKSPNPFGFGDLTCSPAPIADDIPEPEPVTEEHIEETPRTASEWGSESHEGFVCGTPFITMQAPVVPETVIKPTEDAYLYGEVLDIVKQANKHPRANNFVGWSGKILLVPLPSTVIESAWCAYKSKKGVDADGFMTMICGMCHIDVRTAVQDRGIITLK